MQKWSEYAPSVETGGRWVDVAAYIQRGPPAIRWLPASPRSVPVVPDP